VSRVALALVGAAPPASLDAWLGVQDGQAPAPSGKLAGDRDRADGGAFAPGVQPAPALMQPAVARLGPFSDHGGLSVLSGPELPAGPIGFAVVPGRLDQQPPGMGVTGLGDRALDTLGAAGLLGWDQPEIGADPGAGEAPPVADLDRQSEPGQDPDPAQAAQPADQRRP
jgi:hypothetical protein